MTWDFRLPTLAMLNEYNTLASSYEIDSLPLFGMFVL